MEDKKICNAVIEAKKMPKKFFAIYFICFAVFSMIGFTCFNNAYTHEMDDLTVEEQAVEEHLHGTTKKYFFYGIKYKTISEYEVNDDASLEKEYVKTVNETGVAAIADIYAVLILIPVAYAIFMKFYERFSLNSLLYINDKMVYARFKLPFTEKTLMLPIEALGSVLVKNGLFDKIRGGKTIKFTSNSKNVRLPLIQNVDELADFAMERMQNTEVSKIAEVEEVTMDNEMDVCEADAL